MNPVWQFLNGVPIIGALIVRVLTVYAGGGSASYVPSGVLSVSTTTAGTAADTNETDLWTYAIPANTLNADAKGVRVLVYGTFAANGNNKTVRLYCGATAVTFGTFATNGKPWSCMAIVIRTGASAQLMVGTVSDTSGYPILFTPVTPAGDTTGAITIKVTGQNGTASANDVVFRCAIVESLN